ncbi:hypothetical protein NBRC116493_20480 [Aurantivibrio infirmus]
MNTSDQPPKNNLVAQPDKTEIKPSAVDNDKRRLFKSAGTLGAMGVAGGLLAGFGASSAQAQNASGRDQGSTTFAKPGKLKDGAQLDSRFPVSFNESVSHGLRLIVEYFTALNQRDHRAIARTLHFPFAIYEDIDPIIFNSEADFIANPPATLNGTGKGYSKIAEGSYDLLESVNVHLYCPVGGVFSLSFARYTKDGNKLLDCDGLFSVTNNDGRWAIQLVSTLVHERGYEKNQYPDAEMTHRVGSQGYLAAFGYRDEELLNDLSKGRGSFEEELPVGTKRARVSFNYGPRDRSRNARENRPMDGWVTAGVKSRLSVSEVTAETGTGSTSTNLDQFVALAGGTVGEYDYTRMRPDRPLVIHATHDKAHVLGGYWRYTASSELISETRSVSIRIYKGGRWGGVGNLGQVTHHDRSNSG